MLKKIVKGFTIIELLVVLAVIGVFTSFAYPNISNWITDRDVKKEVYETVTFIKEIKSKVKNGEYGMIQLSLKPNLEVYTMSKINFISTYKSFSNSSYKTNSQCSYGTMQSGFVRNQNMETLKLSVSNNNSNVHVYPNGAHHPLIGTVLCITQDDSIIYNRLRKTEKDPETGEIVDIFIFCSKSNSTQYSCKYNTNLDYMYKITINQSVNTKVYKYSKKYSKNKGWMKIDG